jgi:hypothetical protein
MCHGCVLRDQVWMLVMQYVMGAACCLLCTVRCMFAGRVTTCAQAEQQQRHYYHLCAAAAAAAAAAVAATTAVPAAPAAPASAASQAYHQQ